MEEFRRSPVDTVSISSPLFTRFLTSQVVVWEWDVWTINSISQLGGGFHPASIYHPFFSRFQLFNLVKIQATNRDARWVPCARRLMHEPLHCSIVPSARDLDANCPIHAAPGSNHNNKKTEDPISGNSPNQIPSAIFFRSFWGPESTCQKNKPQAKNDFWAH